MDFTSLNLCQPLLDALDEIGYVSPTPIQAQAIPYLIEGRDIIGCAQTGTGKTAAFALPILDAMAKDPWVGSRRIRALMLCPTRELATQIHDNIEQYARHLDIRSMAMFGGVSQRPQENILRRGVDILVATPGRLLDLISQGYVDLSYVQFLVLDEADRMLDMGFIRDIRKILAQIPKNRQSLLFSATIPRSIVDLSRDMLYDPVSVSITPESATVEAIEQSLMFVMRSDKRGLLTYIIEEKRPDKVLVFSRTKHGCNRIVRQLGQDGIEALPIHGNKSQGARENALRRFRNGTLQVLVATDVASRGIDVSDISHVINLDLPNEPEVYVHRIGRTGRAGQAGITIAFCDENEGEYLREIEKMIRQDIPVDEDHPFHSEKARSRKGNKAPKKQQNRGRGRHQPRNGKSDGKRSNGKSNHQSNGGRNGRRSGRGRSRKQRKQRKQRKHRTRY
ncbi:MAG: DEAD/DEAH box helicase [Candidatus Thalassarchaeum betae]|uniref:DEAD/DEAH box helicase n=1 Tax=Candidatus Thalassarchaeum betae TaxID=2599289 RepID=A0A2V3HTH3_9ARCH|nr:MAG: DEAD/DEAH box helicase [Candidatus Thalassoarchaea betae]HIM92772.1 DEAD/DEAH box helicase [Candidatus Poseidoniales archaeon]